MSNEQSSAPLTPEQQETQSTLQKVTALNEQAIREVDKEIVKYYNVLPYQTGLSDMIGYCAEVKKLLDLRIEYQNRITALKS